jgi:hypothetical protein
MEASMRSRGGLTGVQVTGNAEGEALLKWLHLGFTNPLKSGRTKFSH